MHQAATTLSGAGMDESDYLDALVPFHVGSTSWRRHLALAAFAEKGVHPAGLPTETTGAPLGCLFLGLATTTMAGLQNIRALRRRDHRGLVATDAHAPEPGVKGKGDHGVDRAGQRACAAAGHAARAMS